MTNISERSLIFVSYMINICLIFVIYLAQLLYCYIVLLSKKPTPPLWDGVVCVWTRRDSNPYCASVENGRLPLPHEP